VVAFTTFYNTEALEGAGIDYTTIKTWDDFQEAGVKYHEETGKAFGVASTSVMFVEPLITAQLGGQYLDADGNVQINSPEVVEVDPGLRVAVQLPQMKVGIDEVARHGRCQTSCMSRHRSPGSASRPNAVWHGSVCVHHSWVTGSCAIRAMSASWSAPVYS